MSPFAIIMNALRGSGNAVVPAEYKAAEYAAYVTAALYEAIRDGNVSPEDVSVFGKRAVDVVRAARAETVSPWSITGIALSEAQQRALLMKLEDAKRYASRLRFPTEVWYDAESPYIKVRLPEPVNCTVHVRYTDEADIRLAYAIKCAALLRLIANKRGIAIATATNMSELVDMIRARAPKYAEAARAVLLLRPLPIDKEPKGFATLVQRAELQTLDMMRAIHLADVP